jgi:hypothetical protein
MMHPLALWMRAIPAIQPHRLEHFCLRGPDPCLPSLRMDCRGHCLTGPD